MDTSGSDHDIGASDSDNDSNSGGVNDNDVESFQDSLDNAERQAKDDVDGRADAEAELDDAATRQAANQTNAKGKAGIDVSRGQRAGTKAKGELDAKQCTDHTVAASGQPRSSDLVDGATVTGGTVDAKTCHGVVSNTKGIGYGASATGEVTGVSVTHEPTGITVDVAKAKGDVKAQATAGPDGVSVTGQASVQTTGVRASGQLGQEKEEVDVSVTMGDAKAEASGEISVSPDGIAGKGKLGASASCMDIDAKTTIDTDFVDVDLSASISPCKVGGEVTGQFGADESTLSANGEVGVGLGVGAKVGFGVTVDVDAAARAIDGLDMDDISGMFSAEPPPANVDYTLMP